MYALADESWTKPQTPFRIADNLFYVGSADLAAYLVTTPSGHILINSNLESSPPQVRASVETLGFKWSDIRVLLNSQAHFDHTAGAAQILRETGAKFMVMEGDAAVAESGGGKDFADLPKFPPAHVDRVLHDGDTVTLGGVVLTAHKTAGHSRGCTTWTMKARHAGKLLNVVIVGGFAALDEYRLVDAPSHKASYPGIAADFERTFAILRDLPCDIFLGAHGGYFDMQRKLVDYPAKGAAVFIDPEGYKHVISDAQKRFKARLAEQKDKASS